MKTKTLLIFILAISSNIFAQQNMFTKVFYESNYYPIQSSASCKSFDKSVMTVGYYDHNYNTRKGLLLNIDSLGEVFWNKTLNPNIYIESYGIIQTNDSSYAIKGFSSVNSMNGFFMSKISKSGDAIFQYSYNADNLTGFYSPNIYQTKDSGYLVLGHFYDNVSHKEKSLILKLNSTGDIVWNRLFSNNNNLRLYDMVENENEDIFIYGNYYKSNPEEIKTVIIKLNNNGDLIWSKKYYKTNESSYYKIEGLEIEDNNLVFIINDNKLYFNKIDFDGNITLCKSVDSYTQYSKLKKLNNEDYILINCFEYNHDIFPLKLSSEGNFLIISEKIIIATDIIESDNDKGFFIIGNGPSIGVKSFNNSQQIGLIKTDSLLNSTECSWELGFNYTSYIDTIYSDTTTVSVSNINLIKSSFNFSIDSITFIEREGCIDISGNINSYDIQKIKVYPNPANDNIFIENENEFEINSIMEIFDILGSSVYKSEIKNKNQTINISNLNTGIYTYKISNNSEIMKTGKVIKMK